MRLTFFDKKTAKFVEEKTDIRPGGRTASGPTATLRGRADDAKAKGWAKQAECDEGGGATTKCALKQPEDKAGEDDRKAGD